MNDNKSIIDIISQILGIVKFLHLNEIMHRNINPDCFYLNKQLCKVFLLDMGSCCKIKECKQKIKSNLIFSSPEMVTPNKSYDESTDIWSIGVILQCLLHGHSPYVTKTQDRMDDLRMRISRGEFIFQADMDKENEVCSTLTDYYKK